MRTFSCLSLLTLTLYTSSLNAAEPIVANFDNGARPKNWAVNTGYWEPKDGVLVCRELEADNHAAASRWQIPLSDGIVQTHLKFHGATAFHIGFDPAPGQLQKQGHLYSLILTPTGAMIKKHRDKADDTSQDETLAAAKWAELKPAETISIELQTKGDDVTAKILLRDEVCEMKASDPTFHVAKPTIVFRTVGGDVHLWNVSVQITKPGLISAAKKAR